MAGDCVRRWAESVGRLLVVPTPIGNLGDITVRGLEALRVARLILAEDTRHTRKLLRHYGIATRLLSYHQHNKRQRLDQAAAELETGDVALVSDAGMPAIADPGFELIEMAIARGIEIDVLPGPSAVITAVVGAAIPAPGFLFAGFLPRASAERRRRLQTIAALPYSLVFYEAPHRVLPALRDMLAIFGDRTVVAARELSKVHQEYVRGTLAELLERYSDQEPRGEFTLVVAGAAPAMGDQLVEARVALEEMRRQGVMARDAVDAAVARFGVPRNEAYDLWLETGEHGAK